MKHITVMAAMVAVLLAAGSARSESGNAHAATPPKQIAKPSDFRLTDAAPSIEVLLDRLLKALAANDAEALHRLRVTKDEYLTFVLPGSAKPGEPPQALDAQSSQFAWDMLNTKSHYAGVALLNGHGGKRYRLEEVRYLKGHQQYLWYDAYKVAELTVESEDGTEGAITLGSIVHIGGEYKFIGLIGNK